MSFKDRLDAILKLDTRKALEYLLPADREPSRWINVLRTLSECWPNIESHYISFPTYIMERCIFQINSGRPLNTVMDRKDCFESASLDWRINQLHPNPLTIEERESLSRILEYLIGLRNPIDADRACLKLFVPCSRTR